MPKEKNVTVAPEPGRDGALRRPRRVQRRNIPARHFAGLLEVFAEGLDSPDTQRFSPRIDGQWKLNGVHEKPQYR